MWNVFIEERKELYKKGRIDTCILVKVPETEWHSEDLSVPCAGCEARITSNVNIRFGKFYCKNCFSNTKILVDFCEFLFFFPFFFFHKKTNCQAVGTGFKRLKDKMKWTEEKKNEEEESASADSNASKEPNKEKEKEKDAPEGKPTRAKLEVDKRLTMFSTKVKKFFQDDTKPNTGQTPPPSPSVDTTSPPIFADNTATTPPSTPTPSTSVSAPSFPPTRAASNPPAASAVPPRFQNKERKPTGRPVPNPGAAALAMKAHSAANIQRPKPKVDPLLDASSRFPYSKDAEHIPPVKKPAPSKVNTPANFPPQKPSNQNPTLSSTAPSAIPPSLNPKKAQLTKSVSASNISPNQAPASPRPGQPTQNTRVSPLGKITTTSTGRGNSNPNPPGGTPNSNAPRGGPPRGSSGPILRGGPPNPRGGSTPRGAPPQRGTVAQRGRGV